MEEVLTRGNFQRPELQLKLDKLIARVPQPPRPDTLPPMEDPVRVNLWQAARQVRLAAEEKLDVPNLDPLEKPVWEGLIEQAVDIQEQAGGGVLF